MMKNHGPRRRVLLLSGVVCTIGVWFGLQGGLGLHVNVTLSLRYGLYRLSKTKPAPGQIVRACLPEEPPALAIARGYLTAGACPHGTGFFAKVLAARGGDVVEVTHAGTYVNGHALPNSAPQAHDSGGRVTPAALGRHELKAGETWLYAGYNERTNRIPWIQQVGQEHRQRGGA